MSLPYILQDVDNMHDDDIIDKEERDEYDDRLEIPPEVINLITEVE